MGITEPLFFVGPSKIIIATVFACICILTIVRKSAEATALAIGSIAVGGALYAFDQEWRLYEIAPLFMSRPFVLRLFSRTGNCFLPGGFVSTVFSLCFCWFRSAAPAALRSRSGLFWGDMTPPLSRFSLAETDRLAATVAPIGAVIDAGVAPQFNFFLVVELGRRGIPFQVSEKAWRTFMTYRPWPIPQYDKPLPISIVLRSEENTASPRLLMRTTQFDVMRQP